MAASRTKIAVLILVNLIGLYCDTFDEFKSDILLRGSNEDLKFDELNDSFKNIEPEKLPEVIENTEVTTTELTTAGELKDIEETVPTTTIALELSDQNIVDRVESDFDSYSNNESVVDTTTTSLSPTATSTMAIEAADPMLPLGFPVANLDEDHDFNARVPKLSDAAEPKPQEKRTFEIKTTTPSATSKSATLRNWLQDSWLRPPPGILVPLRPMALSRALAVWNDLTVSGLNVTDVVVVGYDSNGVNWRSRHSMLPSSNGSGQRSLAEALSKLLLKYQDVSSDANSDGTMRALIMAAKLVPYDSALFIITDKGAGDVQRVPLALRALVEKRLKVYTIWTDPKYPSEESQHQLQSLKNISKHTEGAVLPYSLQVMDVEQRPDLGFQQWEPLEVPQARRGRVQTLVDEEKVDTLLVRRGGGEAISLGVPIENGVRALKIYIEGLVEHAVLYPPNDAPQIDLYNESSVQAFSPNSRTEGLSPREVYLAFPGSQNTEEVLTVLPMRPSTAAPEPMVGVWHLSVRCDTCDYRLRVAAHALIHFSAHRDIFKDSLKVRVVGPVSSVRESVLIDEYGTELATLPFSYQPQTIGSDGQEMPAERAPTELMADVAVPKVKGSQVFVKIVGRDIRGEPFVRLSGPLDQPEIRTSRSASISFPDSGNDIEQDSDNYIVRSRLQYNESTVVPFGRAVSQITNQRGDLLTIVQIGLGTRLYGAPGDTLQLYFEVTNYREQGVRFTFLAVGELRLLRGISPNTQYLSNGQTANVIVTVAITPNIQPGSRDFITFTATDQNGNQASISTYVYVTNVGQTVADVWAPELRHNFQGSCIGKLGDDCAQHIWSATIVARDTNSGLLRLTSSPAGLVYDSNFVAGSREEVVAVYRSTCCTPRVVVTAVDAFGNANSYVIDISSYLSGASVAAIVLGIFLFIALILLIVFLIRWCVRRRKESRELPYSTSSRNLS